MIERKVKQSPSLVSSADVFSALVDVGALAATEAAPALPCGHGHLALIRLGVSL